ncbi:MAG TPA: ABC transporter ATP-binding protein [Casimicrobiaceae bacterium]|nr:ABC transporter ATP-binding protein [Casimicrobiaceae bacterium]
MTAPLLEARKLHSYYGSSHVLQGVDFSIGAGEVVALMGRNGMGKTTLLRSMLGLLKSRTGEVDIDGVSATGMPPHKIARLGVAFVPENRGIFPTLTVRENLLVAARPAAGGNAWTFERVMATFPGLAARLGHRGNHLSGGEQQMLTIGRALLTNPRLLILDEATEGLAPQIATTIWRTIRTIRDGGIATVIVDKHFAMLAELADRCVILVKGRKVFDGSPAELAAQPGLREQHLGI